MGSICGKTKSKWMGGPSKFRDFGRRGGRGRPRIGPAAEALIAIKGWRLKTPYRTQQFRDPARSENDVRAAGGAILKLAPARSEPTSFVADLGGRDVVHHGQKRVGNRHRRAGPVAINEENQAAGIAIDLGERRLVTIG